MTLITELPFDVLEIIVNEYLQPRDAVAMSLTSHWGRLSAHSLRYTVDEMTFNEARSFIEGGAWPLVQLRYCTLPVTPLEREDVILLTNVLLPKRIGLIVESHDRLLWMIAQHTVCADFIQLTNLSLSYCQQLSSLPESIGQLASLTSLNLSDCIEMSSLPESIGQLASFTNLNLSDCIEMSSLPESIGQSASLTSLNLSGCYKLSSLSDSIEQLVSLTSLGISCCEPSLSESIGQLASLTTLELPLEFSSLPESIEQLASLTSLNLSESRSCHHCRKASGSWPPSPPSAYQPRPV